MSQITNKNKTIKMARSKRSKINLNRTQQTMKIQNSHKPHKAGQKI
jgi:hypothetical protein